MLSDARCVVTLLRRYVVASLHCCVVQASSFSATLAFGDRRSNVLVEGKAIVDAVDRRAPPHPTTSSAQPARPRMQRAERRGYTWAVGCSEGWSALQWAVHKQLPEIVELLIRSGAATAEEDKVRCSQCHRTCAQ